MNNPHLSDNYNVELAFSPFASGTGMDIGDASVSRKRGLWSSSKTSGQIQPSIDTAHWETSVEPIAESRGVSGYHVDIYGQPRALSKLEVALYTLARSVVIGVIIGYGLVISLVVIHNTLTLNAHKTTGQSSVASLETEP